jgi:hypothetical protein
MKSAAKNKWLKYQFLKYSAQLSPYVPETRIMTSPDFWDLIAKYGHVIVKPVWGSRGRGVIQVSSIGNDKYALHYENIRITLRGKKSTYQFLKRKIGSISYMIQQRVTRPTINGRPFDMRVITQRRRNSAIWTVTGLVVKVAGKGYIVSNNSRSKGDLLTLPAAIRRSSIKHLSPQTLQSRIHRVALLSTRRLSTFFVGHRIYGYDMGLDLEGHPWIIEANLFPSMSHFRKLKDQTMCRRITAYKK